MYSVQMHVAPDTLFKNVVYTWLSGEALLQNVNVTGVSSVMDMQNRNTDRKPNS